MILLKTVYAVLRQMEGIVVPYLDDSYLRGDDEIESSQNVRNAGMQLQKSGFVINKEQSQFLPHEKVDF